jgi:hypothetical protein
VGSIRKAAELVKAWEPELETLIRAAPGWWRVTAGAALEGFGAAAGAAEAALGWRLCPPNIGASSTSGSSSSTSCISDISKVGRKGDDTQHAGGAVPILCMFPYNMSYPVHPPPLGGASPQIPPPM